MKLQSKNQKRKTLLIIALGVLLLACIIGLIVSLIIPTEDSEGPTFITGINIANNPNKMEYYVGEKFDPQGMIIQVITNKSNNPIFVEYTECGFSGFDSSVPNDAVKITVTYKEFTTTLTISVKEKVTQLPDPSVIGIEICDMRTSYTLEKWNKRMPNLALGAYVIIHNPDGTSYGSIKETPLSNSNVFGYKKVDDPCEVELTIVYTDKDDKEYTTTVIVTITE